MRRVILTVWMVMFLSLMAMAQSSLPGYFLGVVGFFSFNPGSVTLEEPLMTFRFPAVQTQDIEPRPTDGVFGYGQWNRTSGARPNYNFMQAFWDHADPGHHDLIPAIRFFIMPLAHPKAPWLTGVSAKFGFEQNPGARPAYAYERWERPAPVDFSHPGAVFEFYHYRPDAPSKDQRFQLLATFTIPEVSPQNPRLRTYYQGSGSVFGVYDGVPVWVMIWSAVNDMYQYRVQGVPTAGFED